MEVNELRIGNMVYNDRLKHVEFVSFIKLEGVINVHVSECYSGVPLTEERLLEFGAKKLSYLCWLPITNLKAEIHFEVYPKEIVSIIKSDFCELILDEIKYVHQLQNLYHALTGEELKIRS